MTITSYSSTFLLLLGQILKVLWKELKGVEGVENGYNLGLMDESGKISSFEQCTETAGGEADK